MDYVGLFTSPEGRITRAVFWIGFLIVIAVEVIVRLALGVPFAPTPSHALSVRVLAFLIDLAVLYPEVMIMAKRLHDRGRSGMLTGWLIVPYMVLMITNVIGMSGDPDRIGPAEAILLLAIAVVALTFVVELGFRRGTPGENEYGPDPLKAS